MSVNDLTTPITRPAPLWTNLNVNSVKVDGMINPKCLEIATTVFVSDRECLDNFLSGEIYSIPSGYAIFFTKVVDLLGRRLECDPFVTLCGCGLETSGLKSTGLNTSIPLVTANGTLTVNSMKFDGLGGTVFNMVGDGTSTLDWISVNIYNGIFGTIQDFNNVIFNIVGFLNTHSLKLDNTGVNQFGTVSIANSIFTPPADEDSILVPATCIIARRLRILYSAFVLLGTSVGIVVDSLASFIDPESLILDTVSFSGTSTTSLSGITFEDKESLWTNNTGNIRNTAQVGELIMTGNATPTTVTDTTSYFPFAGTSVAGSFNQRFTKSGNELTYIGGLEKTAQVIMTASVTSGNNNVLSVALIKNGTTITNSIGTSTANGAGKAEGLASFAVIELSEGDTFTMGFRNQTAANNITAETIHFLITSA